MTCLGAEGASSIKGRWDIGGPVKSTGDGYDEREMDLRQSERRAGGFSHRQETRAGRQMPAGGSVEQNPELLQRVCSWHLPHQT